MAAPIHIYYVQQLGMIVNVFNCDMFLVKFEIWVNSKIIFKLHPVKNLISAESFKPKMILTFRNWFIACCAIQVIKDTFQLHDLYIVIQDNLTNVMSP